MGTIDVGPIGRILKRRADNEGAADRQIEDAHTVLMGLKTVAEHVVAECTI